MDLQLIIVIVVGIIVGAVFLYKLYNFFFGKKEEHRCTGCGGCNPLNPPRGDFLTADYK
jgi:hypothetical protein